MLRRLVLGQVKRLNAFICVKFHLHGAVRTSEGRIVWKWFTLRLLAKMVLKAQFLSTFGSISRSQESVATLIDRWLLY